MANRILQKANEIRLEAERKLQDTFNEDENLIGLEISVEVKINDIPREEMPKGSPEKLLENNNAYLSFDTNKLRFTSETYEVLKKESDGK